MAVTREDRVPAPGEPETENFDMSRAFVLLLPLMLLTTPARAGDHDAASAGTGRHAMVELGAPKRVPTALDSVPHPWPGVALALSAVGAAVPVVLGSMPHANADNTTVLTAVMVAEVITPAAGHLYAGLGRRALIGVTTRAIGAAIAVAGVNAAEGSSDFTYADLAALFGVTMVGVSAVWDVVTVAGDVDQRNREWLDQHAALEFRPLPDGRGPALAVAVRF